MLFQLKAKNVMPLLKMVKDKCCQ